MDSDVFTVKHDGRYVQLIERHDGVRQVLLRAEFCFTESDIECVEHEVEKARDWLGFKKDFWAACEMII